MIEASQQVDMTLSPEQQQTLDQLGLKPLTFRGIQAVYYNHEVPYLKAIAFDNILAESQTRPPTEQQDYVVRHYAEKIAELLEERYIRGEHITGQTLLERFSWNSINEIARRLLTLGPDFLA